MMYGKMRKAPFFALIVVFALWHAGTPAAVAQEEGERQASGEKQRNSEDVSVELELSNNTNPALNAELVWVDATQENYWLGVQAGPIDEVLRSQLAVDEDQGLVVSEVEADSPADEAGLQPHDILLTFAGRPLADAAALEKQINAAGNTAAEVAFLRAGKRFTVEVTPRNRQWLVTTLTTNRNQYRIGVSVSPADDTLRSQLGLPDAAGLVVTGVDEESPAAAAGIQPHDVLLKFGGKPLATIEDLTAQVQEVGEHTATTSLLRGGETLTLQVTPAKRKNEYLRNLMVYAPNTELAAGEFVVSLPGEGQLTSQGLELVYDVSQSTDATTDADTKDTEQPLRELIEQVKRLSQRIDALEESVRKRQSE
jgi:membrane-associated protease RseP (regulator of RpoE activity)